VLFPRRGHFQLSKIKNLLRATTERKQRIRNRNSSGGQGRKANCRVTQGKRDVYVFIKKGETEPGWYDMVWDESPVRRWMIGLLRPKGAQTEIYDSLFNVFARWKNAWASAKDCRL